jgi:hypothetical protein
MSFSDCLGRFFIFIQRFKYKKRKKETDSSATSKATAISQRQKADSPAPRTALSILQSMGSSEQILSLVEKAKKCPSPHLEAIMLDKVELHFQEDWSKISSLIHVGIEVLFDSILTESDGYAKIKDNAYFIMLAKDSDKSCAEKTEDLNLLIHSTFIDGKNMLEKEGSNENKNVSSESLEKVLGDISKKVSPSRAYKKAPKILFRPIKNQQLDSICGYACTPFLNKREGYSLLGKNKSPSKISLIDELTVQSAQKEADQASLEKKKVFFVCPVHYKTLTDVTVRSFILTSCQDMSTSQKENILFELCGVPQKFNPELIKEAAEKIKPYCSGVILRTDILAGVSEDYGKLGINFVSADIRAANLPEDIVKVPMVKFYEAAQKYRLSSIIYGIDSPAMLEEAKNIGFTMISGEMVSPLLPSVSQS